MGFRVSVVKHLDAAARMSPPTAHAEDGLEPMAQFARYIQLPTRHVVCSPPTSQLNHAINPLLSRLCC